MIGESGGVTTLIYQEQINRENQIQRDQVGRQETEEKSSRKGTSDVVEFSAQGLELASTAVTATQGTPEAALEQEPQEKEPPQEEQGAVPVHQANGSSPAQHLDIRV